MARYIDGDKLLEYYEERHKNLCKKNGETDAYCQGYEDAMYVAKHLDFAADVVPRAEYEKVVINMNAYGLTAKRLQEDIERLQELNNRQVEDIRLAKAEVAREIFEEIERFLYMHFRFCKEEIGGDDTEYVKGRLELNTQIQNFVAELKKKWEGEG